jgi:hypothetical protein
MAKEEVSVDRFIKALNKRVQAFKRFYINIVEKREKGEIEDDALFPYKMEQDYDAWLDEFMLWEEGTDDANKDLG